MKAGGPPPFGSPDEAMADWVEAALSAEASEEENSDAVEAWLADSSNLLRASERRALLAAFDSTGEDRWRPVVDVLRAGVPSARMSAVVAELIEHGAFSVKAKLSQAETRESDQRDTLLWHRERVRALLMRTYPSEGEAKIGRRATAITAVLTANRAATVTKARTDAKDARRRPLADLRHSVENDPYLKSE